MNRPALVFLAGCLAVAPLCALEKDGLTITLTDEEDAICEASGGCIVAPLAFVERYVAQKQQEAYEAGKNACNGRNRL